MDYEITSGEMKRLGKAIKIARIECDLLQSGLAVLLDVIPQYISRLEIGLQVPSLSLLYAITDALNIRPLYIFKLMDHMERKEKRDVYLAQSE